MSKRSDIRDALKALFGSYTSPAFGSYPIVNTKDYDIAGLTKPEQYPVVNIATLGENYLDSNIGQSRRAITTFIDVIPWANETLAMDVCDEVFKEIPHIVFSDPQLGGLCENMYFEESSLLAMGTDCPAMKVRFKLIINYREQRPL